MASTKNQELDAAINQHRKQIKTTDIEIRRLDAVKSGIDPSLIYDEINSLKKKETIWKTKLPL
ncbi:hypothetical protein MFMK1_001785 [Metallumcola ferriviriculae]|uniref:Uncharacterized protein n=1 Tax=Metallumcola ferriviriculae TaxID=3039180 RepID=A0AAU0UQ38_9FIRM|nr:hypothetical protein MFMK1_001785 [Desulfitibacteraceae bacterium MK1]